MKRIFGALGIALLMATSAQASILGDALTGNGDTDTLIDDSVGLIQDLDGSGSISVNDVIQGVIYFNEVKRDGVLFPETADPLNGKTLMAVYSLEVDSINGNFVNLGAISSVGVNGAHSISSILGLTDFAGELAGLTNTGSAATLTNDATFALFETSSGDFSTSSLSAAGGSLVTAGKIGNLISGTAWDISLIGGLTGDDFQQIQVGSASYLTLANLATLGQGTQFAGYESAMTVISHNMGGNITFLPLTRENLSSPLPPAEAIGDVVSSASPGIMTSTASEAIRGWHFGDDGEFQVNITPEPASMLAWAGLMGAAGLVAARRRKAAK